MSVGALWGYYVKLHRNGLKMMGTVPLMTYCLTVLFCHFKHSAPSFDDVDGQLPNLEAEIEKSAIVKLCLLSDYSMNAKALLSEVQYAKAPTDYIYSTLV